MPYVVTVNLQIMTIAIYIHALGVGGAERVAVHLANHWTSLGFQVVMITNAKLSSYPYELNEAVVHECLGVHGSSHNLAKAIFSNFNRIVLLRSVIKKHKIEKIVSFSFTANVVLAIARIGISGLYAIGSERNYPPREVKSKLWNNLRRYSYRALDVVTVQTEKTKKWVESNTSAKKVLTIPNPVVYPLPISHSKESPDFPKVSPDLLDGRRFVLAVGRMETQKQFGHLLEAFALLAGDFVGWDLVIVGDGYRRVELEEQVLTLGIETRVCFPGKVGNIASWYARADVFVLCSQFEGFPNVLLEAMAHGLPVSSYDCDTGPADLIINNVNGLLVDPDNIELLSESIRRLIVEDSFREFLAKNATDVRDKFSASTVFAKWDSLLELNSR